MARRRQHVQYSLDAGDIRALPENDIRMILRAADELINAGGRSMLVKILKGSKDKKVLEHKLDECPAYGYFRGLTMDEISTRVDWMIKDARFVPFLEKWKSTEVRKVRERIAGVQRALADEKSEPEISYRKARASEAAEITGLVHKTVRKIYPRYYPGEVTEFFCMNHSKDRIRSDIQNGNVWVLFLDGQIIGTGTVEEGNHITRVYVLPEFQKKGYGTYIMRQLEERIAKEHETAVLDSSLPAFGLYEKLGYQVIRREEMPLWNDAVLVYEVMEKKL